jgi:hypothetical protein
MGPRGSFLDADVTLRDAIDAAAREAIRAALVAASGNVRRAAQALQDATGWPKERTLHREIDRLGLRPWLTDEYELGARQPARGE